MRPWPRFELQRWAGLKNLSDCDCARPVHHSFPRPSDKAYHLNESEGLCRRLSWIIEQEKGWLDDNDGILDADSIDSFQHGNK